MSAESLAIVLHHSRATGTDKVVMLGIANHDGDGGAWPARSTLARYANVGVRAVDRSIARLVELGELRVGRGAGGTAETPDHRRPNRYELLVMCPADCDGSKFHRTKRWRQAPLPVETPAARPASWATPGVVGDAPPSVVGDAPPSVVGDAPPSVVGDARTIPGKPPTEPPVTTDGDQPPVGAVEPVDTRCAIHPGGKARPDGECSGCWVDRIAEAVS